MKAETSSGVCRKANTGKRPVASGIDDLTAGHESKNLRAERKQQMIPHVSAHESRYLLPSVHESKDFIAVYMKVNTFKNLVTG